jgi:hypothetical protein
MEQQTRKRYALESIRDWASHPDNISFHRDVVLDLLAHYDELKLVSKCRWKDPVLLRNCAFIAGHEGKHSDHEGNEF